MTTAKPFSRLLLTGAAGGLGRVLRPRLSTYCERLRLSDKAGLGDGGRVQAAAQRRNRTCQSGKPIHHVSPSNQCEAHSVAANKAC